MKIDKDWFDSKGRYWAFYLSFGMNHILLAICIAGFEFRIGVSLYDPIRERNQ